MIHARTRSHRFHRLFVLPVLLSACAPGAGPKPDATTLCDPPAGCGTTPAPDADGDGYVDADAGGDDCDDADPAVHPGATETWYDGVDQDCDGAWDFDQDGDGEDVSDVGGRDCDDTDPEVPAEETFNRKDDDCDGCVDEPGPWVILGLYEDSLSFFIEVAPGSGARDQSSLGWVWLSQEDALYELEACRDGVAACHPVQADDVNLAVVDDPADVELGVSTWLHPAAAPGLALIFWNAHGDCFTDPPGRAYADLGCPTFDCGVNW